MLKFIQHMTVLNAISPEKFKVESSMRAHFKADAFYMSVQ
jgi:hypothetical protein